MTDEQKAALEWLDNVADDACRGATYVVKDEAHARILKALLAEPRLPDVLPIDMADRIQKAFDEPRVHRHDVDYFFALLRKELATAPATETVEVRDARGTDEQQAVLRKAISVLRGWSAEAAGRMGLQPAILLVCNAAASTLPKQLYRVTNGHDLDVIADGPISISEVDQ